MSALFKHLVILEHFHGMFTSRHNQFEVFQIVGTIYLCRSTRIRTTIMFLNSVMIYDTEISFPANNSNCISAMYTPIREETKLGAR